MRGHVGGMHTRLQNGGHCHIFRKVAFDIKTRKNLFENRNNLKFHIAAVCDVFHSTQNTIHHRVGSRQLHCELLFCALAAAWRVF